MTAMLFLRGKTFHMYIDVKLYDLQSSYIMVNLKSILSQWYLGQRIAKNLVTAAWHIFIMPNEI